MIFRILWHANLAKVGASHFFSYLKIRRTLPLSALCEWFSLLSFLSLQILQFRRRISCSQNSFRLRRLFHFYKSKHLGSNYKLECHNPSSSTDRRKSGQAFCRRCSKTFMKIFMIFANKLVKPMEVTVFYKLFYKKLVVLWYFCAIQLFFSVRIMKVAFPYKVSIVGQLKLEVED